MIRQGLTPIPQSSPRHWQSAFVALLAFAVLFLLMDPRLNPYDEGIVLLNSMRVLHGEVVHRDFYSNYGPGAYLLTSAAFALSGPDFLVARGLGAAVMAGIAGIGHALLSRRCVPWVARTIAALLVAWEWVMANSLYPMWPCLLLALAGAATVIDHAANAPRRALILAGLCAGVAAIFRYDAGLVLLGAYGFGLAITTAVHFPLRHAAVQTAAAAAWLTLGAALVLVPLALLYIEMGIAGPFKADIVDFALRHYVRTRSLPFPNPLHDLAALSVYVPPLIVAAALPLIRADLRRNAAPPVRILPPASLMLAVMAAVFYYKGVVRVSPLHMTMAIVPAVILLGLLIERWRRAGRRMAIQFALGLATLIVSAAAAPQIATIRANPDRLFLTSLWRPAGSDAARACLAWQGMRGAWVDPDYAKAAQFIARRTEAGDRFLAGLHQHDRIVMNPTALYFAANRLPITHWAHYDPGLQTSLKIQRDMAAELERGRTVYVLRDASFEGIAEPNESSQSSGVHDLDAYIEAHYRAVAQSGAVVIWARNGVAPQPLQNDPPACRMDMPHADQ